LFTVYHTAAGQFQLTYKVQVLPDIFNVVRVRIYLNQPFRNLTVTLLFEILL